mmetsp:Transcript_27889/g.81920  ORF Transcript_27889/g.81920 Transcript_27889/m.81920 type:complete len:470 (-) Transcript_27889:199-1608(-)
MLIRQPRNAAMLSAATAAALLGFVATAAEAAFFLPTTTTTSLGGVVIPRRPDAAASSSSDGSLFEASSSQATIRTSTSTPPRRSPSSSSLYSTTTVDAYVPPDLSGRVAVVTGATRGIGKGIALELGAAGMTVYVAGRSDESDASSAGGGGGATTEREFEGMEKCTVQQTAREIDSMPGPGRGVPVKCDVRDDDDVQALFERVKDETGGRLDVAVASAFQTPPGLDTADFRNDFWKQGADMWDCCHGVGLRGAYVTCCEAVPMMIDTAAAAAADEKKESKGEGKGGNKPLIVLISSFGGKSYTFNVAYGVGKAACDRLASDMSVQLAPYGVDTVALYPGVVRTEGNLAMDERGEWDEASGGMPLDPGKAESPRFSGRAVATLLSDPSRMTERSGKVAVVAELAKELGFTDVDGSTPPSIRSLKFILPGFVFPQIEKESGKPLPSFITDNIPDYLLPWSVFEGGPPPTND